jgi:N-acetylglutamate synthase
MIAADYDEVVAFWQTIEGIGLDDDTDSRQGIVGYLDRNPGLSFVVREEVGCSLECGDKSPHSKGRIIGAVLSGHDGRRGYLHHLAVAPECRRQGIGRALVDACLRGLGAAGIQKCNIFLFGNNELGKTFWKHNGWNERDDLKVLQKPCQ